MRRFSHSVHDMLYARCFWRVIRPCPMGMSCAHPFLFLLDVFPTSCPIVDVFPAGCPVGILCTHQFLFLVDVFPTSHPLHKLSVRAHIPSDISLPYLMKPGEVSICFYCFLLPPLLYASLFPFFFSSFLFPLPILLYVSLFPFFLFLFSASCHTTSLCRPRGGVSTNALHVCIALLGCIACVRAWRAWHLYIFQDPCSRTRS